MGSLWGSAATESGGRRRRIMDLILVVVLVAAAVLVGFTLCKAFTRPATTPPPQPQPQQAQCVNPAALRKQRLDEARQRRFELEQRVAEEDDLLEEEEDCAFLKQELKDIRNNRRIRKKGQPKP